KSDLTTTIIDAAQKVTKELVINEDFAAAVKVKNEYKLFQENFIQNSLEVLNEVSRIILEKAFTKGDVSLAISVINDYHMSNDFVREQAEKYLPKLIKDDKYYEVFEIIDKLKINTSSSELKELGEQIFEKAFDQKKYELSSNIGYYFKVKSRDTKKAAFFAWQKKIQRYEFEDAFKIRKDFQIPKKAVQGILKDTHKKLMNEGRKDSAKLLKKQYNMSFSIIDWILDLFRKKT
ncbi:hypothetical protein ACFL4T_09670, partial [candidate division KSB1 bacterium]